jgi:hypothetical protein
VYCTAGAAFGLALAEVVEAAAEDAGEKTKAGVAAEDVGFFVGAVWADIGGQRLDVFDLFAGLACGIGEVTADLRECRREAGGGVAIDEQGEDAIVPVELAEVFDLGIDPAALHGTGRADDDEEFAIGEGGGDLGGEIGVGGEFFFVAEDAGEAAGEAAGD